MRKRERERRTAAKSTKEFNGVPCAERNKRRSFSSINRSRQKEKKRAVNA
jgi:hypothetical protein